MKTFLLICTLGAIANFCNAFPQNFLMFNNGGLEEASPSPQTSSRPRPYSPLPPMQLPPFFQNQGFTRPPPPPPPFYFQQVTDAPFQHLQLGHGDERFLFNFLSQLKPIFFPWLRTTTAAPSTTEASTTEASTTAASTTEASTTAASTTEAPTTTE